MNLNLPQQLQQQIQSELMPFEQIRWVGQPTVINLPASISWGIFIFGIPWTAFAVFWTLGAGGFIPPFGKGNIDAPRLIFSLFGIPFILVGLWMLSRPFTAKNSLNKLAMRTAYVITDKRAIIVDGGFCRYGVVQALTGSALNPFTPWFKNTFEIQSFTPDLLKNIKKVIRQDGSGDIIFQETQQPVYQSNKYNQQNFVTRQIGFISVPDVDNVERMIKEINPSEPPMPGRI